MPDPFTRAELRREALREIGQRRRVYPRLISQGKLRQADADRQIALMQAIADHYAEPDLFAGLK
jgi:hypothetical protein